MELRLWKQVSWISLAAVLVGCGNVMAPAGAERIPAPSEVAHEWAYVLDCSGLGASPDAWKAIRWHTVTPDAEHGLLRCQNTWTDGCWIPRADIYLLAGREHDPWLLSHEMLHYRLQDPAHTHPAWKACGL